MAELRPEKAATLLGRSAVPGSMSLPHSGEHGPAPSPKGARPASFLLQDPGRNRHNLRIKITLVPKRGGLAFHL